jgi:hypothetical protein
LVGDEFDARPQEAAHGRPPNPSLLVESLDAQSMQACFVDLAASKPFVGPACEERIGQFLLRDASSVAEVMQESVFFPGLLDGEGDALAIANDIARGKAEAPKGRACGRVATPLVGCCEEHVDLPSFDTDDHTESEFGLRLTDPTLTDDEVHHESLVP